MTTTVIQQLHSLLGALLLGVCAGVWYDLLRCLRYRLRRGAMVILLDLLFWLTVTTVLFLWCVTAGDGKVQISVCAALFLGGAAYFHWFSRLCFPLLSRVIHFLLFPFRWLRIVKNFFANFCKKHFSFRGK